MSRGATRVADLADYLANAPQGATVDQMAIALGVTRGYVNILIHRLRIALGKYEDINVVCNPNPADPNGRWLYELVGTMENSQQWVSNRIIDTTHRIETMSSVVSSVVKASDGRTRDGKKARVISTYFGKILVELGRIP